MDLDKYIPMFNSEDRSDIDFAKNLFNNLNYWQQNKLRRKLTQTGKWRIWSDHPYRIARLNIRRELNYLL